MKKTLSISVVTTLLVITAVLPMYADDIHPRGIILDGTISATGKLDLQGPNYEIRAEYGQQAGANLFHSFQQFNIRSDESARFSGPDSVRNIISRITGGDASWIDGPLISEIPGADLYLMNRAGMMFGPNASLNISGSFHAGTADYLSMGESERFYTLPLENEVLSTAPVTAFGFLNGDIAGISVEGRGDITVQDWLENPTGLHVPGGNTISFVAGDIEIKKGTFFNVPSRLTDPDGKFTPVDPGGNPLYLDDEGHPVFFDPYENPVPYDSVRVDELILETETRYPGEVNASGGRINMASVASAGQVVPEESNLDVSSYESMGKIRISEKALITVNEIIDDTGSGQGAGNIFIRGGAFVMDDSAIQAETVISEDIGRVDIQADTVSVRASHISASTRGIGTGGDIAIIASESLRIGGNDDDGEGSAIVAYTHTGDAGKIQIKTEALSLSDGAEIITASAGPGTGGDIILDVSESVTLSGSTPHGKPVIISVSSLGTDTDAGDAGTVCVETKNLFLDDGAQIASISKGGGKGGDVRLHATGLIRFSGNTPKGEGSSIVTETSGQEAGTDTDNNAGDVLIDTKVLSLHDGAWIGTYTDGSGDGGAVNIRASESVELSGRNDLGKYSIISSGSARDDGGPAGNAGTISVTTKRLSLSENGAISTKAEHAGGGQVEISADEYLRVSGGGMTTSVKAGGENAGNIRIKDSEFVTLNRGRIIANAYQGEGGNIDITAEHFIESPDSVVDASSALGIDGSVKIEAPDEDIGGSLSLLPSDFRIEPRMRTCAGFDPDMIQFALSVRDGIPRSPDTFLPSPPLKFGSSESETLYLKGDFKSLALSLERSADRFPDDILLLAYAYQSLGYYRKAIDTLLPALEKATTDNRPLTTDNQPLTTDNQPLTTDNRPLTTDNRPLTTSMIGDIYLSLGNAEIAERYLRNGVEAARMSREPLVLAATLNNMAVFLATDQNYREAMTVFREALGLIRDSGEGSRLKSKILTNIARNEFLMGRREMSGTLKAAIAYIEKLPDSHDKASDLLSLSLIIKAANATGKVRKDSSLMLHRSTLLSKAAEISEALKDHRIASSGNGYLAQLYEAEAHHEDAIRLTRRAIFFAQQGYSPDLLYLWQWQLGRLFRIMGETEHAVRAYRSATETLDTIRKKFFTKYCDEKDVFSKKVRPVYLELTGLLLRQAETMGEGKLNEARDTMEGLKKAELQDFFQDECVTAMQKEIQPLNRMPRRTALLYPILFPDHLTLLLTLPGDVMKQIHIPADPELPSPREAAVRLRRGLQKSKGYKFNAKLLYNWLIRPIAADLAEHDIDTLIIAPDGPLRLIPFSALFDEKEKRFLIQKYALATIPAITLTDPKLADLKNRRILLNGLSEDLPWVANELADIREIMGHGRILLNEDYTLGNLTREFEYRAYPVVHIATHGQFGCTSDETFLKTYSGDSLTMKRLEELVSYRRFSDEPVGMLVLSACETALGTESDERAALGLAGVALKAGAESAIGTLWSVNDESASKVITEFYREFKAGLPKAKALQAAQNKFISHPRYSHPNHWAAFLLIGNWL